MPNSALPISFLSPIPISRCGLVENSGWGWKVLGVETGGGGVGGWKQVLGVKTSDGGWDLWERVLGVENGCWWLKTGVGVKNDGGGLNSSLTMINN